MTKGLAALLIAAAAVLAAGRPTHASGAIRTETGRFQDLIARLAGSDYVLGEPSVDPRPYADPTPALHAFRHLAAAVAWGDLRAAAVQAAQLDYELVNFIDAKTKHKYYVLREDLSRVGSPRGWGSYIFNRAGRIDVIVEAPHPLADAQTPEIGGAVFEQAGAKGFLLAGAHRLKADVPRQVDSIFHQVHAAWIGPAAHVAAWQIHGFSSSKHSFPDGVHVIASTGDGLIAPEMASLDAMFESEGLTTYVFNKRPAASMANKRLNGDVPGVTFRSLAATTNEQGRHSRSLGGSFVHVELESQVRLDAAQSGRAAAVIAAAMNEAQAQRIAMNRPSVTTASYAPQATESGHSIESMPPADALAAAGASARRSVADGGPVGPTAPDAAAIQSGAVGNSAVEGSDGEELDLARTGTPRPERSDGSRPRRVRKRDS